MKHSPKQLLERVLEKSGELLSKGSLDAPSPFWKLRKVNIKDPHSWLWVHCPCVPHPNIFSDHRGTRLSPTVTEVVHPCPSVLYPSAATMATHSLTSLWCWGILSGSSPSWRYPDGGWGVSFWLEHPGTAGCWSSTEAPGALLPWWLSLLLDEGKVCLSPVWDCTCFLMLGFLGDLASSQGCRFGSSPCPVVAPTAPVPSMSVKARLVCFLQQLRDPNFMYTILLCLYCVSKTSIIF